MICVYITVFVQIIRKKDRTSRKKILKRSNIITVHNLYEYGKGKQTFGLRARPACLGFFEIFKKKVFSVEKRIPTPLLPPSPTKKFSHGEQSARAIKRRQRKGKRKKEKSWVPCACGATCSLPSFIFKHDVLIYVQCSFSFEYDSTSPSLTDKDRLGHHGAHLQACSAANNELLNRLHPRCVRAPLRGHNRFFHYSLWLLQYHSFL